MAGKVVADTWENGDGTENFKCRAWVNFNGTGTVAIRESGNVASITDLGVGNYVVNLLTSMVDVNYCAITDASRGLLAPDQAGTFTYGDQTVNSFNISINNGGSTITDCEWVFASVLR